MMEKTMDKKCEETDCEQCICNTCMHQGFDCDCRTRNAHTFFECEDYVEMQGQQMKLKFMEEREDG